MPSESGARHDQSTDGEPSADFSVIFCIEIKEGSFSPITFQHLRLFEICKNYLESEATTAKIQVLGGFISPVHDGYAKKYHDSTSHLKVCVSEFGAFETSD